MQRIQERIDNGEKGYQTEEEISKKIKDEDREVRLEPEDELWVYLADQLYPALPPDGYLPVPSEAIQVLQMLGIFHPDNQSYVLDGLRYYWSGRAEGLAFKAEKPKKSSETPNKPSSRRSIK